MLLGCIGDDFTGSSDLGNTLSKAGMKTVQYSGVPEGPAVPWVEAGIVALKSRTLPVQDAIAQSLAALKWLQDQGCQQFFFKYCSTFDSTPAGNIGPVAEALAAELGTKSVIFCPAFPGAGRTLYQGHLFTGDRLLSESGMENHPLTPMTDPDLRRVLAAQLTRPVGHIPIGIVFAGPQAIAAALAAETAAGRGFVIADALRDADLIALGEAASDLPLLTGGSGLALGLPGNFRRKGVTGQDTAPWQGEPGRAAILSGSCSAATRNQIAAHQARGAPVLQIRPADVLSGAMTAGAAVAWALDQPRDSLPLICSSADPARVAADQQIWGRAPLAHALDAFFAKAAALLVAGGVRRLISAGGETSGAVVTGLGVASLEIGPEIAPGVPVLRSGPDLVLALKSGNFGDQDFFSKAAALLAGDEKNV